MEARKDGLSTQMSQIDGLDWFIKTSSRVLGTWDLSNKSILTAFIVFSTSQNCHGNLILHFVIISHKLSRKSIKTKFIPVTQQGRICSSTVCLGSRQYYSRNVQII